MQLKLVRLINSLISAAEIVIILVVLLFAAFALWDNQQVYQRADAARDELLSFKPDQEEDSAPSFEELQAVNPDVCAWLTMDGTRIDYPVLQGEDNFEYLSLDVYGEFSLAGSIYLDSRNDRDFCDAYSLLHGHHLDQGRMFGDLDLYKQQEFFEENTTGILLVPGGYYSLDVMAYLLVESTDDVIFAPQYWTEDAADVLEYCRENAVYMNEPVFERAQEEGAQLLCLATCSTETTEARTIVICVMTWNEYTEEVMP